jgi:hypothetical protein
LTGNITVSGTHTYEASGHDTVTVTLRDDSPGSASATATSKVTIPPVKLRINPVDGDNVINYAEAHATDGVFVTGREKGLVVGETFNVTVTDRNFSKTYTAVVGDKGSWAATIPMVDALKLANGTATVTAQVGDVKATEKATVAETLPTVTINKANGNDIIINQVASCGDDGGHGDGRRDQHSVGWQQWADYQSHGDDLHDGDAVTLTGTVSGIAARSRFQVTVHDGTFSKSFTATVNANASGWMATIPGREVAELPTGTATVTAQVTDRYRNTSLPAVQLVTVKTSSGSADLGSNHCDSTFKPSATRTVIPDDAKANSETLAPTNLVDLGLKGFGAGSTLGYAMSDNNTDALFTGSDGNHLANIALLHQYISTSFVTPSEGYGGTIISESPRTEHPLLSLPHG